MKRIHITGPPRSGTTLMLELMVTCFKIDVYSKKEISVLVPLPSVKPNTTICTKNPNEWSIVPDLLLCDPDQWFIFMVRDPRDVVVSRHKLKRDIYWANLRQWNSSWRSIRKFRDHERLLIIFYEDLVRHPDEIQSRIVQRIPFLQFKILFSQFHLYAKPSRQSAEAMNSIRPISESSIGRWRNHKARLAGQLKLHGPITDVLIELGYEKDAGWLKELDGISPDTSPGFWQDFIPEKKRQELLQKLDHSLVEYKRRRGLGNL